MSPRVSGPTPASIAQDAPSAYFRLDETSGTVAKDLSSKPTNGSYRGLYTPNSAGLIGGDSDPAIYFNGGSIIVPKDSAAQPTGAITVEAWFKADQSAINAQAVKIVANSESWAAPYDAYLLGLSNGAPIFHLVLNGVGVSATATSPLVAGVVHHLVGTYDGAHVRLWLDGRLVASTAATGVITNYTSDGLAIGSDVSGNWVFRGTIDEVAVYPQPLSLNRILVHEAAAQSAVPYVAAVLGSNPAAYYRLNESVGSTAFDASPNQANGAYASGISAGLSGLLDALDPSANFTAGTVSIGRNGNLFPSAAISLEAVVQPTSASLSAQEVKILSGGTPWVAPYDSYKLALDGGYPVMAISTAGGADYSVKANAQLTAGGTYHLVGTYNGSSLAIYANGQLLLSSAASGAINPGSGSGTALGGDVTGNWLYRGILDDVAIYPTALSASLVAQHAALISGLSPLVGATASPTPTPTPTPTPSAKSGSSTITLPIFNSSSGLFPSVTSTPSPTATPSPTPSPTPTPTPTPVPLMPIAVSNSSLNILSLANTGLVTISEANYQGAFTVVSTNCKGLATATISGSSLTVVPVASGSCSLAIHDTNGQSANVAVTVTLTSISGS